MLRSRRGREHCCAAKPDLPKDISAFSQRSRRCPMRRRQEPAGRHAFEVSVPARQARSCATPWSIWTRDGRSGGSFAQSVGCREAEMSAQISATRMIADDTRIRAAQWRLVISALPTPAAPLGSGKAELAFHYLRIGAERRRSLQRCLGQLLLESERSAPDEAAEYLRKAAEQGDEQATELLSQLGKEAEEKRKEAMFKLKALASSGDERAKAMLVELEAEEGVMV